MIMCDKCSVSVFGVSAESMQCSYDEKGNSVPTILLLMQQRLYSQQGLKVIEIGNQKLRFLRIFYIPLVDLLTFFFLFKFCCVDK